MKRAAEGGGGGGEDTGRTRKCLQRMMEEVGHSEEKRERGRERASRRVCERNFALSALFFLLMLSLSSQTPGMSTSPCSVTHCISSISSSQWG